MHTRLLVETLLLFYSLTGTIADGEGLGKVKAVGFGGHSGSFQEVRRARERRSIRLGSVQGALDFITSPETSSFLIPQFVIGVGITCEKIICQAVVKL